MYAQDNNGRANPTHSTELSLLPWMRGAVPKSGRALMDVPREQGYAKFETYPIDKQLDVYLCAMNVEPPDLGLADLIAQRGEGAIPIVLERLKTANKEIDQEDIIYLLEIMSDRGLLRGRKDVIADISDVIEGMKISQSKESSFQRLKQIEINSGVKPRTSSP